MRTDNENLFCYSLISFTNNGYSLEKVTLDLHKEENLITTEYEDKFVKEGVKIKALIAKCCEKEEKSR